VRFACQCVDEAVGRSDAAIWRLYDVGDIERTTMAAVSQYASAVSFDVLLLPDFAACCERRRLHVVTFVIVAFH